MAQSFTVFVACGTSGNPPEQGKNLKHGKPWLKPAKNIMETSRKPIFVEFGIGFPPVE